MNVSITVFPKKTEITTLIYLNLKNKNYFGK